MENKLWRYVLIDWINALIIETQGGMQDSSPVIFFSQKLGLSVDTDTVSILNLEFPTYRTLRSESVVWSHRICGVLLQQFEWTTAEDPEEGKCTFNYLELDVAVGTKSGQHALLQFGGFLLGCYAATFFREDEWTWANICLAVWDWCNEPERQLMQSISCLEGWDQTSGNSTVSLCRTWHFHYLSNLACSE